MNTMAPATPAPKSEYIKLPGTKGPIMVKAVETARSGKTRFPEKRGRRHLSASFLAILCGEAGETIELFAGTYRTALG